MKGTVLKQIAAMTAAMVMTVSAGSMAFAAPMGTNGTTDAAGNSVTLKKAITVINHDDYKYEPTINYTYTISDGAQSGQVTDDEGRNAKYKAGLVSYVAGGASKAAEFSSDKAVSGDISEKDVTFSFDESKFPSAGVYRFKVTETTSVAPAEIGIARPVNYDAEKFLDVFVKNENQGLSIYGYALVDDETDAVTSKSAKSQGWNAGDDLEQYETFNITVTKNITGALADMTAQFPFKVSLNGKMDAANIAIDGSGADLALANGTASGLLGNGKTMIIKGLPKTVSFAVTEDNPTIDTYKTTATVSGVEGTTNADKAKLAGSATDFSVVTGGHVNAANDAIQITVENNLEDVSPTGLVLRYAPYALILAAGIVLLVLSRRRKAEI